MIVFISDFNIAQGSGYTNISTNLCNELFNQYRVGVTCLGFSYRGEEHNYSFPIVPLESFSSIPMCIKEITNAGGKIDVIIVALDVPLQVQLKQALIGYDYIGIFPLEAPPLSFNAAKSLSSFDSCLVMSDFAKDELLKQGIKSEVLPLSVNSLFTPITLENKKKLRKALGYTDNDFVILTIAENQERKNLFKAAEILSKFTCDIIETDKAGYVIKKDVIESNVYWNVVTTINSVIGWDLDDLMLRNGIEDITHFYERGLPLSELISLYQVADCFLLTSKAEGLGLPILEAMACGVICLGNDCTAIHEHLTSNNGILIDYDYIIGDPFGNQFRYMINVTDGVNKLKYLRHNMSNEEKQTIISNAIDYMSKRSWKECSDILFRNIKNLLNKQDIVLK